MSENRIDPELQQRVMNATEQWILAMARAFKCLPKAVPVEYEVVTEVKQLPEKLELPH